MGFGFERGSPALKEILLKMRMSRKPPEVDHFMYELGSVEYRIQSSASDPYCAYFSLRMPAVRGGSWLDTQLSEFATDTAKRCHSKVCQIVQPPTEGYMLTMRIDLAKIPQKRELQIISKISTLPALVLSSELKELLRVSYWNGIQGGASKPFKLTYHLSQSFFVIPQPRKLSVVFPMRFKENLDVNIATAFFQLLSDEGSSYKWAKAPQCTWSPIPPSDLRGQLFEDLNTNAGFISFDIYPRHLEVKKLDKITWTLIMFYAFVNYHIKMTKCYIQRRMKMRLKSLLQVTYQKMTADRLQQLFEIYLGSAGFARNGKTRKRGCSGVPRYSKIGSKTVKKLRKFYKSIGLVRRSGAFVKSIKRLRYTVRIRSFNCFRGRCARTQKEVEAKRYIRLH
ncbi:unnamed protein product [Rhodiola kirilowii]